MCAALVSALLLLGCSATDDEQEAATAASFCQGFPARDAATPLAAIDDPRLAGSVGVTDSLLDIVAQSTASEVPEALRPSVKTYASTLQAYDGTADPRADAGFQAAVADINRWLVEHCPTSATGTTGGTGGTAPP